MFERSLQVEPHMWTSKLERLWGSQIKEMQVAYADLPTPKKRKGGEEALLGRIAGRAV